MPDDRQSSPPPCRPGITPVGPSREQAVPGKGEQGQQHRTDADWRDQEVPGHIVDNHHKWIDPRRRVKRPGQMHCDIASPTASAAAHGPGPKNLTMSSPMNVETRWPPIRARGCAGSALGEPSTVTIDVAKGIATSGKAALAENTSMPAIATAPPVAPARMASNLVLSPMEPGEYAKASAARRMQPQPESKHRAHSRRAGMKSAHRSVQRAWRQTTFWSSVRP